MKFYTLILDRSGSMSSIWNEITDAVNKHIEGKSKNSLCSLLLFDSCGLDFLYKYENNPDFLNKENFQPRGNTPLRDSIVYSVETLIRDFKDFLWQDEVEVEFTIFTDGEENSSIFWKSEDVARSINHFQENYNWKFSFIGHGNSTDVANYAKQFGIKDENVISYENNEELKQVFEKV